MNDDFSNLAGLKIFSMTKNGQQFDVVSSRERVGDMSDHVVTIFNPDPDSSIRAIGLSLRDYDDGSKENKPQLEQHFNMIEVFKAKEGRWKGVSPASHDFHEMQDLKYLTDRHAQYIRLKLDVRPQDLDAKKITIAKSEDAGEQKDSVLREYSGGTQFSSDPKIQNAFIDLISDILSKPPSNDLALPDSQIELDAPAKGGDSLPPPTPPPPPFRS